MTILDFGEYYGFAQCSTGIAFLQMGYRESLAMGGAGFDGHQMVLSVHCFSNKSIITYNHGKERALFSTFGVYEAYKLLTVIDELRSPTSRSKGS